MEFALGCTDLLPEITVSTVRCRTSAEVARSRLPNLSGVNALDSKVEPLRRRSLVSQRPAQRSSSRHASKPRLAENRTVVAKANGTVTESIEAQELKLVTTVGSAYALLALTRLRLLTMRSLVPRCRDSSPSTRHSSRRCHLRLRLLLSNVRAIFHSLVACWLARRMLLPRYPRVPLWCASTTRWPKVATSVHRGQTVQLARTLSRVGKPLLSRFWVARVRLASLRGSDGQLVAALGVPLLSLKVLAMNLWYVWPVS